MPVGASTVVPEIAPKTVLVASPSFAFNLNCSGDAGAGEIGPLGEVAIAMPGSPAMVPNFGEVGISDGVEDALHDDDDHDDVEPATIADDIDDDTPRTTPVMGGRASSLGTNQYPPSPHFSALDLDAMAPQGIREYLEEVVLSVKTYNIRRGVEYKVLKSNHRKYYGKCKEFSSGCAWLIRVSLRQRRGIWEVKRYNGPHTCLTTSISSDHRKLDYHAISAFIFTKAYSPTRLHREYKKD
ncbi:hypothetical protein Ahy_B03g067153 isoform B [Arachis hypogaea]|uniref:Uncharacterized protein n=1 Tax=Arachis hypogaea TaxID=3818 RepID=A0A445A5W3_ARAHY|nr:hypothetical protein Ahy_B03g067153 isoform B [Arachis hypogaea]